MQHPTNTGLPRRPCRFPEQGNPSVSCGEHDARWPVDPKHSASVNHPFAEQTQYRGHAIPSAALALLFVVLALLFGAGEAFASWPVESDPVVTLGFEETYLSETGRSTVHHGVDCAATAGETVTSPVSGTVSFVGTVPAGEVEGCGTAIAVSLALSDGRTLTLMPFEETWVGEGEPVDEGMALGLLAANGDRSSALTHLHVGLKRERVYYNPLPLLGLPVEAVGAAPPEEPVPVEVLVPSDEAVPPEAVVQEAPEALVAPEERLNAFPFEAGVFEESTAASPLAGAEPSPVGEAPEGSEAHRGPVVSSGDDALAAWQAAKEAAESDEAPRTGFLEQACSFFAGLYERVIKLVGDVAPALAGVAPIVASLLLAAVVAGLAGAVVLIARSSPAKELRHRIVGRLKGQENGSLTSAGV